MWSQPEAPTHPPQRRPQPRGRRDCRDGEGSRCWRTEVAGGVVEHTCPRGAPQGSSLASQHGDHGDEPPGVGGPRPAPGRPAVTGELCGVTDLKAGPVQGTEPRQGRWDVTRGHHPRDGRPPSVAPGAGGRVQAGRGGREPRGQPWAAPPGRGWCLPGRLREQAPPSALSSPPGPLSVSHGRHGSAPVPQPAAALATGSSPDLGWGRPSLRCSQPPPGGARGSGRRAARSATGKLGTLGCLECGSM